MEKSSRLWFSFIFRYRKSFAFNSLFSLSSHIIVGTCMPWPALFIDSPAYSLRLSFQSISRIICGRMAKGCQDDYRINRTTSTARSFVWQPLTRHVLPLLLPSSHIFTFSGHLQALSPHCHYLLCGYDTSSVALCFRVNKKSIEKMIATRKQVNNKSVGVK